MKADRIARELGVPRNYLAKTLHRLSRQGVLASVRGRSGGFRLQRSATELTVAEIVSVFDAPQSSGQCVMSGRACDPAAPCEAHREWSRWTARPAPVDGMTIADLLPAEPMPTGPDTRSRNEERTVR